MPEKDVSASEIAEYAFCSTAWYMDKEGYRRSGYANSRMTTGRIMHRRLETKVRRSKFGARAYLIVAIAIAVVILTYLMEVYQ